MISNFEIFSQVWPKYYGENNRADNNSEIIESYDQGILVAGYFLDEDYAPESTWLIKSDNNGNVLWDKVFINTGYNKVKAVTQSSDGGIIICGLIRQQSDEISNPFVTKLNACGEKEWCRIFGENIGDAPSKWANDVKETPAGDIIVLVNQYGYHPINTMHLFKLNADGEVLWRNPYASATQHPGSINPRGNNLLITSNGEYLIAGQIYWEDDWNHGGPMGIRSLFVMVDSLGNEKWVLPFGTADTIFGQGYNIYEINNNSFIGIASKWPSETMQTVIVNFDSLGSIKVYAILNNDSIGQNIHKGVPLDLLRLESTYVIGGKYGTVDQGLATEFILDTNLFNNVTIHNHFQHSNCDDPYALQKTVKNKLLSSSTFISSGDWDISLSKLNQNLEYDTLDPGNYTYDSLCTTPGLPQSGFISLDDCDLFTDIDEIPTAKQYREKIRWIPIKAYPNPVMEGKLTLEFENTEHHQNMELRCYDDFGRQIHSQKIYKGQQDTDVDVSGWSPGIYVAVFYSNGGARGKAKFVVK